MNQEIFDWILLLTRWLHITVAVTWIGTSIFFMWLDRTFEVNEKSTQPGHVGEVWMVHGGGFYHVEKLLMGPTKVPERLHWFKWESYWTWISGMLLIALHFYSGDGTFLLDSSVSNMTYIQAVSLSLFSIFGSWFFYDFIWERGFNKNSPVFGHILTLSWLTGMAYLLCHTMSGRAAYIHIGGMLGTWMTANVFMRIIPRQIMMVEASRNGVPVNQDWGKNAKNRSTHNTYFTLPVIFIMLSNHFPQTYGHDYNWVILLLISAGGAAIREYFVVRLKNPKRSIVFGIIGITLIMGVILFSLDKNEEAAVDVVKTYHVHEQKKNETIPVEQTHIPTSAGVDIKGVIFFEGEVPKGKKLSMPAACAKLHKNGAYSNEVIVKNGKLQNVLVRIIKGHEGKIYDDIPSTEVVLDQRGCMYSPRVIGARVGQKVTFINSDSIFHNVKSVTSANQKFNMAMPHKDQRESKVFTKSEIFLQAKCSVHPWMGAYVAILDHPFFSVSNANGEFKISNIPEGQYVLEAWHEVYGTQTKEITVTPAGISDLKFIFK